MSLWSRLVRRKSRKAKGRTFAEESVLVISDIHLGEDVLNEGPEHLSGYIRILNRELTDFVRSHAQMDDGDRRWHLVINGDMFDFVKVSIRPGEEDEQVSFEHLDELEDHDSLAGLPNTPEVVVWKLGRILEIHRPLFVAMAEFLFAGNRISIIEGNHDAEFYFPEVQASLRDFVIDEAKKMARKKGVSEKEEAEVLEELGRRLIFSPWFTASSGRFHIEHGHQHDALCSFEYNLIPLNAKPKKKRKGEQTAEEKAQAREEAMDALVATPMSHQIMPYFAEYLGDFSTHGVDTWTFRQWFSFVFNLGPRVLVSVTFVYFRAMWVLLRRAGSGRERSLRHHEQAYNERLLGLSQISPYGAQTLHGLAGLRAKPAEYSLFRMVNLFYVDQLILGIGSAVGIAGAITWGVLRDFSMGFGTAALIGGVWTLGVYVLTKLRGTKKLEETLRRAAAKIADTTGARYVVFGHSHHPELIDLSRRYGVGRFGERAYYINSGSWVTREILRGESGSGMTYVRITPQGAALLRWIGDGEPPEILNSTYDPNRPEMAAEGDGDRRGRAAG